MLAVPVALLRAANDSFPLWSVECAGNSWQGAICRVASTPVSLNDMLCLEQGAALVVVCVVLASEVSNSSDFALWICLTPWCGVVLCIHAMFNSNPNF